VKLVKKVVQIKDWRELGDVSLLLPGKGADPVKCQGVLVLSCQNLLLVHKTKVEGPDCSADDQSKLFGLNIVPHGGHVDVWRANCLN